MCRVAHLGVPSCLRMVLVPFWIADSSVRGVDERFKK
jgi:hypothetical protein